jgi:predicted RNase H-like HicB family nuclease
VFSKEECLGAYPRHQGIIISSSNEDHNEPTLLGYQEAAGKATHPSQEFWNHRFAGRFEILVLFLGGVVPLKIVTTELNFEITAEPDGGFSARAREHPIITQGDTLAEVRQNIEEAVRCHFDNVPGEFRVRISEVKEEFAISTTTM